MLKPGSPKPLPKGHDRAPRWPLAAGMLPLGTLAPLAPGTGRPSWGAVLSMEWVSMRLQEDLKRPYVAYFLFFCVGHGSVCHCGLAELGSVRSQKPPRIRLPLPGWPLLTAPPPPRPGLFPVQPQLAHHFRARAPHLPWLPSTLIIRHLGGFFFFSVRLWFVVGVSVCHFCLYILTVGQLSILTGS